MAVEHAAGEILRFVETISKRCAFIQEKNEIHAAASNDDQIQQGQDI